MKIAGCTILLVALCLTGCEPLPVRPEPQPPPPPAAPVAARPVRKPAPVTAAQVNTDNANEIVSALAEELDREEVEAALSALAVALLLVGTGVSMYFAHQAHERANLAVENEGKAKAERESARRNQYVAEMNLVQRAWRDVEMTRVRALLNNQLPRSKDETDFRGPEWHDAAGDPRWQ